MTSRSGGGREVEKMVQVPVGDEDTALLATTTAAEEGITSSSTTTQGLLASDTTSDDKPKKKIKRIRKKVRNDGTTPGSNSALIKYGSLVLLVAQLVGLVMLMRYSRTHTNGSDLYLSSTAVFCMEVSFCFIKKHRHLI